MKKFFAIITLISMIIFVGCVDVDELWNEIDSLKKENQEQADELGKYKERLKIVEDLTSLANSDIAAIKAIVDALNKNVSIVSYKELADKSGYQLTMSDGSTITLRHGLKGDKGDRVVIGSKAFGKENRLYWTLDGEFLLDADGNKIPVTGDKGARGDSGSRGPTGFTGISPILRVNENGNWEVSYDYGKGWQEVKDKSGNPVSALGSQGESGEDGAAPSLSITETPQTVTITLNGDEYVIPKGNAISQIDPSLLIGQWNVLKYQDYSDENGQWGDWEEIEAIFNAGYHFMDDSNGSYPYFTNFGLPMNHAFDYVVTGDKLLISELEWNHGAVGKAVMTKSPGYYLDTLTIIQLDDENLILEYNSKYGRFREHLTRGVVPNPLSFVAEYNIAGQGHYFVDDLTYNHISDYYNYYIGVMEYKSGHMIPDGAGGAYCYYLPRIEEWQSIVPGNKDYVAFYPYVSLDSYVVTEKVMVQGNIFTMTSDFYCDDDWIGWNSVDTRAPSDNDKTYGATTYAIRYKGTSMVSAWKYEYVRGEINPETGNRDYYMKITSRSLFGKEKLSVREIADDEYWAEYNEEDVVRYFPASGYKEYGDDLINQYDCGYFLSSTPVGSDLVTLMYFDPGLAFSNYVATTYDEYSVRLFTSGIKVLGDFGGGALK